MFVFPLHLARSLAAAMSLALMPSASPAWARAEALDGTELVRHIGEAAFAALREEASDTSARKARLRALYKAHFDRDGIAAQILGRAWRQANGGERRKLADLIEEYFVKLLAGRLADFARAEFRVLISEPDGDGVVVYSQLADPRQGKYLNLKWRLAKSGTAFKVRDLVVENVSVVLHQRRELAAEIDAAGDNVAALLRALRERIARLAPPS